MTVKQLIIMELPFARCTVTVYFEHSSGERGEYFTITESENWYDRYNRDYESKQKWQEAVDRFKKKAISIDVRR